MTACSPADKYQGFRETAPD